MNSEIRRQKLKQFLLINLKTLLTVSVLIWFLFEIIIKRGKDLKILVINIFSICSVFIKEQISTDNTINIFYAILIIFLIVLIILVAFRRFIKWLEFQNLKPMNHYTLGYERWATNKDKDKQFMKSDIEKLMTYGYLLDRYKQYRIFKWSPRILRFSHYIEKITGEDRTRENYDQKYKNVDIKNKILKKLDKVLKPIDTVVLETKPQHYLLNASSQSGKTQTIGLPQLQMITKIKKDSEKPNLVISDPKGELLEKTKDMFENAGYDVVSINLKYGTDSASYDPLALIKSKYEIYIEDNILKGNEEFSSFNEYIKFIYSQKIDFSQIQKEINTVSAVLMEVSEDKEDSTSDFFVDSAYSTLVSCIWYLVEKNYYLNTLDELNMKTLSAFISNNFIVEEKGNFAYKEMMYKLPDEHYSKVMFPALVDKTLSSAIATLQKELKIFNSDFVASRTSTSTLNFQKLLNGKKPQVIYIVTEDYDSTLNKLVSLLVTQIYIESVKYADATSENRLPRKLQFYLEEFASIPKIDKLDQKLTICLARGIQFFFIVQNMQQIINKYGENPTKTILDNIKIKMFLSSGTVEGREWFKEEIGKTTILKKTVSGDMLKNTSVSFTEEAMYLASVEQLDNLEFGTGVCISMGNRPVKSSFKPFYQIQEELRNV